MFFRISLQTCNVIKKRHQHRCFPVLIAKFISTALFKPTPMVVTFENIKLRSGYFYYICYIFCYFYYCLNISNLIKVLTIKHLLTFVSFNHFYFHYFVFIMHFYRIHRRKTKKQLTI